MMKIKAITLLGHREMMVAVTVCKPRFFAIVARLQSQYKMLSRRLDMNIGCSIEVSSFNVRSQHNLKQG